MFKAVFTCFSDLLTPTPDTTTALVVALSLHAAAHPVRLTGAWVVTWEGVAARPLSVAPYRPHPAPLTVGMAAVPAPATPPPLGEAPGSGPLARQEGVYTPTAHEGAPG